MYSVACLPTPQAVHRCELQAGNYITLILATVYDNDPTALILTAVMNLEIVFQQLFDKSADIVVSVIVRALDSNSFVSFFRQSRFVSLAGA